MDKYVVVMAGGVGSRFWPLSREKKPKQFINVDGDTCMLVQTIDRICKLVPTKNCFVITNKELIDITKDTLQGIIPLSNIIEEPLRKNTATCIAYATLLLKQKFKDGLIAFLPADAYVKDSENYLQAIETGYNAANETKNIVTIGIKPTYPATGYGYIQVDKKETDKEYSKVITFIEKPDYETATELFTYNNFLWNSGIVLADMNVLIDHIKSFLPEHYEKLANAVWKLDTKDFSQEIKNAYEQVQNISFDIGVLEKTESIYMVKGIFDWDDMGSMEALSKTLEKDENGNYVKGNYIGLDTKDCIIYSEDMLITTIGMENVAIASTKDAIIICPREKVQYIKELVNELKINGYEDFI